MNEKSLVLFHQVEAEPVPFNFTLNTFIYITKYLQMKSRFIVLLNLLLVTFSDGSRSMNDWKPLMPSPRYRRPVEIMADVINNIGMKMLDCYVNKPGNVAFSPAGLTFVMAALFEGSAGHGSRQIAVCLGFPRDRRITRIGLRDIHRRLRTYLNADAFLGGLTLNRDDIILRPEYEDVLRFYGFDIGDYNDNNVTAGDSTTIATTIAMNITNGNNSEALMSNATGTRDSGSASVTRDDDLTTLSAIQNNTTDMPLSASTEAPVTTPQAEGSTPAIDLIVDSAVDLISTDNNPNSTELSANLVILTTTSASVDGNLSMFENRTILPPATIDATTVGGNSSDDSQGKMRDINNGTDGNQRLMASSNVNSTEQVSTTAASIQNSTDNVGSSDDNNVRRRRRSIRQPSIRVPEEPVWIDDDSNNWQDYVLAPEDDPLASSNQHTTQLNFLVQGCDISTITTTTYTAILPFAYFPSLHALGLEFPLDDPRYTVIILVPADTSSATSIARLLPTTTLRHLRSMMKPTWVRATIPSFSLRGFITLTPYLQKLGVKDTFEPRAANLSPMSPDLGIYARDIQQSIGVNIRNYMKPANNTESTTVTTNNYNYPGTLEHKRQATPFVANRPFLFFIVDTETSVSLIAGRIDDPLNSRIN